MKALSRLYRPRHARIASITAVRATCPCPRLREGSLKISAEPKSCFESQATESKEEKDTTHEKRDPKTQAIDLSLQLLPSPDCFALFDTQCSFIDFFLQVLAACFFWTWI